MYERMLDKQSVPTLAELTAYCGENAAAFADLNEWLTARCNTAQTIVFPYGKQYGWGVAHRVKKNLVCNVFAENGAFTVMLRLSNRQFDAVYAKVHPYAQALIDNKYPCSDGGWVHFRVQTGEQLADVRQLLCEKCGLTSAP